MRQVNRQHGRSSKKWRFSILNLLIALLTLAGVTIFTYPYAAKWVAQYHQSQILVDQNEIDRVSGRASAAQKLEEAREYNQLLSSGALLEAGAHVAHGIGADNSTYQYDNMLRAEPTGIMARIRIPSIELDLPVYHGTDDATLLKGIGHLRGTSLPVGGPNTRSVLTGHRGLAEATMFTNLNQVTEDDSIILDVLGETLTYRVFKIQVVDPNATEEIKAVADRDLLTLVTCTPLGINTHRILVTAERVVPTPIGDIESSTHNPTIPYFPWWLIIYTCVTAAIIWWYWHSGYARQLSSVKKIKHHETHID